ncbi:L,D-transpeptidase [Synechococcus sp. RSCCF101]|uniref:L,D-transpeptidase family protein n=1 Tax=Synechococcus sp. RSCCF101 TaxID=2511069 RepID=UPI00124529CD|nr:L,D-transpeptidase family protein [Synechococcus sp. RSCCF101]QEY31455.1 L,D-transpeptidase [Synechococcus sp. RSCCF101]
MRPAFRPLLAALAGASVLLAPAAGRAAAGPAGEPEPSTTAPAPAGDAAEPGGTRALALLPTDLRQRNGRHLVLDRQRRRLYVLESGSLLRLFPVAVGMPGWETPTGRFEVIEMTPHPIWEHPETGRRVPAGPANPLGSRWIGFHQDCLGREAHNGERVLSIDGCVSAGFHGTPHRWTVGRAVSHGCVRLYDEDVRALYDIVEMGMPVTVLP